MKKIFLLTLGIVTSDLLLNNCATQIPPTGGPKDTIPPKLISSAPEMGKTNYQDQTVLLLFDERINTEKLKQNLIVTPRTTSKYTVLQKKYEVIIKFNEPFNDSTTYNLNFFNGITDATEKNPAVNLNIAFSTGSYIDSLKIQGTVADLLTQEKQSKTIVGLYPVTDTLNYFTDQPSFFTTTLDSGDFKLSYLRKGTYKLLAFQDENGNLLLDSKEEYHGFLKDTIHLTKNLDSLRIRTLLQDIKPLEMVYYRTNGQYTDIQYNKGLKNYTLKGEDILSNLVGTEEDIIRLYRPIHYQDSLKYIISATDSLHNVAQDTIIILFTDAQRRKTKFEVSTKPELKEDTIFVTYKANKPLLGVSPLLVVSADTLYSDTVTLTPTPIDDVTGTLKGQETMSHLLQNYHEHLLEMDTNKLDSLLPAFPTIRSLAYTLSYSTFISIEQDTTSAIKISIPAKSNEKYGTIHISTQTRYPSYTIQLLVSDKVKYEKKSDLTHSYTFQVKPATYAIRILIDDNEDGKWSYGNLLTNSEPETVYLYPENTTARINWVQEISIAF